MGPMYSEILDGQQFHSDDIKPLGQAVIGGQPVDRVLIVEVDYEAAHRRSMDDIRRNIETRKTRENNS